MSSLHSYIQEGYEHKSITMLYAMLTFYFNLTGKVEAKNLTKRVKRELRRDERRNQAAQIRHRKREEVVAQKRQVGSAGTAPILVAIIALSKDADPFLALERLKESDSDATITVSQEGYLHLRWVYFYT